MRTARTRQVEKLPRLAMRTIWYLRAPGRAERRGLVPEEALLSPPAAACVWAAGRGAVAHGCV